MPGIDRDFIEIDIDDLDATFQAYYPPTWRVTRVEPFEYPQCPDSNRERIQNLLDQQPPIRPTESGDMPRLASYRERLINDVRNRCGLDPLPTFSLFLPGEERYSAVLSTAFNFIRRAADCRYSSRALMRLVQLADRLPNAGPLTAVDTMFPPLVVAELPFEYNEETEVKKGGVVGMLVALESGWMLAVAQPYRRKKVATVMVQILQSLRPDVIPTFWLGNGNLNGQQFVSAVGFQPIAFSAKGAIQYGIAQNAEE